MKELVLLLIIGTIRLPPSKMGSAKAAMQAMIEASRSEEGCLLYAYAEDILEPGLVRVSEYWTDRAALDRHFESRHIAQWRSSWSELGITDRQLQLYEVEAPAAI